jgi:Flp pilus assembly protein TadG
MRLTSRGRRPRRSRGQALVEFALVFPMFMLLMFGVIVLGLYVFYNQQLANATGEAARYAAVHSTSAVCPTVSRLDSQLTLQWDNTVKRCDAPENGWPKMTAAARSSIWGMSPSQVSVVACWSGFVDPSNNYDALSTDPNNTFTDCTMRDPGLALPPVDPRTDAGTLPCPATTIGSAVAPPKADGDDKASAIAAPPGAGNVTSYPTTVTVYSCFKWTPPMAGFVLIPSQITLRAVVTEVLQRQQ